MDDKDNTDRMVRVEVVPAPGTVTIDLVTQVSTTANASFDRFVSDFSKRISEKADELFGPPQNVPKPTGE
jgi:hypothetical protein